MSPSPSPRILLIAALLLASAPAAFGVPAFKLFVAASGPYRVSFEDLAAAGLRSEGLPSATVGLFHDGHATPAWVEDGGDGLFGPGDWLELIGERPYGWVSHLDEDSHYNVYFLRFDADAPPRMTAYHPAPVEPSATGKHHALERDRHDERDHLLHPLARSRGGRPDERWYWARLSHLDSEPFAHTLDLGDLATDEGGTVDLRIELRGESQLAEKPDPGTTDHRIEVFLGEAEITSAEWDGTESFLLEIPDLAVDRFTAGNNDLRLRIPKRAAGAPDQWLTDIVLLNWIEVSYPRRPVVGGPWADFHLSAPQAPELMRLVTRPDTGGQAHPAASEFVLYGRNGSRMTSDAVEARAEGELLARVFYPADGESSFIAVSPADLLAPEAIIRDRPSRLTDRANGADYIMIAHRRLLAAIQPLATLHRSRGLDVEVVDVQDVYDEFTGGQAQPWALRAFLDHAFHRWRKPAPRFVLLVGDADSHAKDVLINDGNFPDRVEGADDQDSDLVNRHLIPTWHHAATDLGLAMGDNHFVAGQDGLPDMAIGRLPVVEPAEVAHIVDKTIRYIRAPEVGPWRRNIVFLTDTSAAFQDQSRWLADDLGTAGFRTEEIAPSSEETGKASATQRLTELLNQGQLLVHDLARGAPEHLEHLNPTRRLPVVLSLTQTATPVDHPNAGTMAKELLQSEGRGAIAVVTATRGNAPSATWGQSLLKELTTPGTTVGEAVMRAKRTVQDPAFVKAYNLLGDPAVPMALPTAKIALTVSAEADQPLTVSGTLDTSAFSGELLVELLGGDRQVLHSATLRLNGFEFAVKIEAPAEDAAAAHVIRAYAWDASRGIDAIGVVELAASAPRGQPPATTWAPETLPDDGQADDPTTAVSTEKILTNAVAWWSFDQSSDGIIHDRLDNHQGSLTGHIDSVDRVDRPRGAAFGFDGRGVIDFGPRLDLGTGDFTLHAWVATRQARRQLWVILDKRTNIGYHLFNYWGRLGLQLADGGFTNYEGPFIADGDWHHIAVTVDRDRGDGIRWYVDGREVGPRQDPTAHPGSLNNTSPLTVGGRHHGGGNFVGDLDEVAIFKRALTSREVAQLYRTDWTKLNADSENAP